MLQGESLFEELFAATAVACALQGLQTHQDGAGCCSCSCWSSLPRQAGPCSGTDVMACVLLLLMALLTSTAPTQLAIPLLSCIVNHTQRPASCHVAIGLAEGWCRAPAADFHVVVLSVWLGIFPTGGLRLSGLCKRS